MQEKQKKVVVFVSPSCKWCTAAKQYLTKQKIKFKTIDITKDAKAAKDCERHGCKGVPALLIGTQWICGFEQKRIDKALGLKK